MTGMTGMMHDYNNQDNWQDYDEWDDLNWFIVITGLTGMVVLKQKSRITGMTRMNGMMT